MANIKSQIKRNRQNEKAHDRNKAVRSELKTRYKTVVTATEAGDAEATQFFGLKRDCGLHGLGG